MKPDITYRLREAAIFLSRGVNIPSLYGLLDEAAREKERLRKEIERLKKNDK